MVIQVTDRLHEGNIKREVKRTFEGFGTDQRCKKMLLFRTADIPAHDMVKDIQFKSVTE